VVSLGCEGVHSESEGVTIEAFYTWKTLITSGKKIEHKENLLTKRWRTLRPGKRKATLKEESIGRGGKAENPHDLAIPLEKEGTSSQTLLSRVRANQLPGTRKNARVVEREKIHT